MSAREIAKRVITADPDTASDDRKFLLRAYEEYGLHLSADQANVILTCPSPWSLIREKYKFAADGQSERETKQQ